MGIIIGSARIDENGNISGGVPGDQTGQEVSTQDFYVHSSGWNIIRATSSGEATKLAKAMKLACNNAHIGYNQDARYQVVSAGVNTTKDVNADCSSLVRACIIYATGEDVGDFTTATEKKVVCASSKFKFVGGYVDAVKTPLYNGDILVSKKKGHTVIVVSGGEVSDSGYYPKYTGDSTSIVDALKAVGETDTSLAHRQKIAIVNGISTNISTTMNIKLLSKLKAGKLKKA